MKYKQHVHEPHFSSDLMNVLLIEDDKRIAALLKRGMMEDGHHVETSHRGDEGRDFITSELFDAAVVDVMLPGLDGFEILRHARAHRPTLPILLLTARNSPEDIVRGLDLGGDDYLTKPFELEVFLAHLRAVSRRGDVPRRPELRVDDLALDRNSHTVRRGGRPIALTKKEYALLELLMRRAGQVVTRDRLIEAGWGIGAEIRENSLDVYMHALRLKIDGRGPSRMLRTVRSLGYTLTASL